ncbi:Mitochondrial carrier [Gracilaria domingensis]|nr:Mitochondrial carrier [Gracilaria domingensis]
MTPRPSSFISVAPIHLLRQSHHQSRTKSPPIAPRRVLPRIIVSSLQPSPASNPHHNTSPTAPSSPLTSPSRSPLSSVLRNLVLAAFAATVSFLPLRAVRARHSPASNEPTIARATSSNRNLSSQPAAVRVKQLQSGASHGLEGTSFVVAGTAALLASTLAVSVTHPIDTLKTLKQASSSNVKRSSVTIRSLYRGVLSNILKEAPNAAIYLATYELFKVALMSFAPLAAVPLFTMCLAGMLGDALGSIVRVPAEIVNKRLQLQLSSNWYEAIRDAFLTDVGVQSTVTSWVAVLCRDVPYGGLQIAAYECVRLIFAQHGYTTLLFSVVAGAIAGLFASIVTTPADVLVTRLSTQPPQCYLETKRYMGCLATFRRIWKDEGFCALWSGAVHRGLFYMPMIGLFFAAYESFKYLIVHPQIVASVLSRAWILLANVVVTGLSSFGSFANIPVLLALVLGCSHGLTRNGKQSRSTNST